MKKRLLALGIAAAVLAGGAAMVAASHNTFSDVPEGSDDYWDVSYANDMGWVGGYEDGTFKPERTITASQIAKVIDRAYPDGMTRADFTRFMAAGDNEVHGVPGTKDRPFDLGWYANVSDYRVQVLESRLLGPTAISVKVQVTYTGEATGTPGWDLTGRLLGVGNVESGDGFGYNFGGGRLHPGGQVEDWLNFENVHPTDLQNPLSLYVARTWSSTDGAWFKVPPVTASGT